MEEKHAGLSASNLLIVFFSLILFFTAAAFASGQEKQENSKVKKNNTLRWTIVPGPFYNPNLGVGLQLIPIVSYKIDPQDKISPPSTTGGMLMVAKPDWSIPDWSFLGFVGQKLFLNQDKWRINFGAGGVTMVFRKYAPGNLPGASNDYVLAKREGLFVKAGAKRKIWQRLYGGLNYNFQYYTIYGRSSSDQQFLDAIGIASGWQFQSLLGAEFLWDSRDNQFSPTKGLQADITLDYGAEWLGGNNNYALLKGYYAQYYSFVPDNFHILAWKFGFSTGFGDVPPDKYNSVGKSRYGGIRGYLKGEFEDLNLLDAEIEYRFMFVPRFGGVVFAGLGTVFGKVNNFSGAPWLPGGGFGLRFAVIPDRRINARLDLAWGIDSFTVYFGVGESF